MNSSLKMFGVGAASWVISMVLSFVLIIVTAGVTEKWGAARTEKALLALFAAVLFVFLASAVTVHLIGKRIITDGSPWVYTLLYSGGTFVTLIVLAFAMMVIFNR